MNKAVFLDRDGTINIEKNYLYRIEEFEFTYKAQEAIKSLKDSGFLIIIITNQAGIARGFYTEGDVEQLHQWINAQLKAFGTRIDAFFYCPHHPDGVIEQYSKQCKCRKPNTGLYEEAINKFNIDVRQSYVIGDKISDLIPGILLGMKTILVETGYGKNEAEKENLYDLRAKNLFEASKIIIKKDLY